MAGPGSEGTMETKATYLHLTSPSLLMNDKFLGQEKKKWSPRHTGYTSSDGTNHKKARALCVGPKVDPNKVPQCLRERPQVGTGTQLAVCSSWLPDMIVI